jgi:fluoride exporter
MSPATIPNRPDAPETGSRSFLTSLKERTTLVNMTKYLMVGLGGFLGSVLRFWLAGYVGNRMGTRFPYGTFIVNCTACFLIGLVVTLLAEKTNWSSNWRYLLPIGFIGGYSTFSTFEYETFRVFQDGEFLIAGLNVILSVVVGFISVWLGVITGRSIA